MSNLIFGEAYKKLNKAQKEAVDAIEGPVMVVAGPGTGKTQILTLRIGNILKKTDASPENILALTFTDAGVQAMRKRLSELIGSRAYQVSIATFHSFCQNIISENPEHFPRIIGSKPSTEVDQIALIEKLIDEHMANSSLSLLSPFGDRYFYVRDILSSINELKREGVDENSFIDLVNREQAAFEILPDKFHVKGPYSGKMKGDYQKIEKKIKKNRELSILYKSYQDKLSNNKIYDYSDMIMEVLKALKSDESLLLILQERYQYFLVDEHQDTNNAQNKILELLAKYHAPNPNLFIVGDDKQAIFRFQGASLENFYYFRALYPDAKLITLTDNYRSTQNILDASGGLINSGGAKLFSVSDKNKDSSLVHLYPFQTAFAETYFVIKNIKERIDNGVKPSEIAILYRNNKDAFLFASLAEKFGVPYVIESDLDLFSDPDVKKLLLILRSLREHERGAALAYVLHLNIFKLPPLDVYRVIRKADNMHAHGSDKRIGLWEIISDKKLLNDAGVKSVKQFLNFCELFSNLVSKSHNMELLAFIPEVLRDTGMLEDILSSSGREDRLDAINSIIDEIKLLIESNPKAELEDFFSYLDTIAKHNLFIKKNRSRIPSGRIRLMTIHKSKGLEFEYVYVVNCYSGHLGGRRDIDRLPMLERVYDLGSGLPDAAGSSEDDDRRLLYVAITRAKKWVGISYAKESDDGREQLPSPFILEIDNNLVAEIDTAPYESEALLKKEILFMPEMHEAHNLKDKDFVRDLFLKNGLSVSALNNYLSCPWKYFYRNLIRIPTAPEKYLSYGTAIHAALQEFFSMWKEEDIGKEFLIKNFIMALGRQPIAETEYKELLEKGSHSLSGWYDAYNGLWERNTESEFRINGVILSPEIRLTGVLDKVEFIGGNAVNVVDYKTGKPKTRNELLGKTKNANGDYHRQLVFYRLLLNNYGDGKYDMKSGTIDFIEPGDNGKYHKEVFEINDKDVEELKLVIYRVADEILSLSFWDKRCDDKECEFCHLRDMIAELILY
ncbi:MAG TPA: ATP-dependent DNA helicase [Candidatus Paceibacterota bacterium]|nr:ATP-dependent DNA helicase [Candidatus Paceibacterota bacterium]